MKTQLIFDVEEGQTFCTKCPFNSLNHGEGSCIEVIKGLNCEKYNLATLKFKRHDEKDSNT